jgi:hypothetical protein
MSLRARIEQRITDLRVERDIAAAARLRSGPGTHWEAHDELQRAGEMYARAYAGYHYGRGDAALADPKEDA